MFGGLAFAFWCDHEKPKAKSGAVASENTAQNAPIFLTNAFMRVTSGTRDPFAS
jgi:hypothetical protein